MRCLSIQQPWSWLIANGIKDIENRTWDTRYRGFILIHAGKTIDGTGFIGDTLNRPYWRERLSLAALDAMPQKRDDYDLGGIIGYATLKDVVTKYDSPWFIGPYGFVLTQRRTIDFIPLRGQLGLFDVPAEIEAQINEIRDERAWDADLKDMAQIKREWRDYRLEGGVSPPWKRGVSMDKTYKLCIFDVDGTLTTTKSGATFRKTADDWQWLPGRLERLHQLDRDGMKLAIATNQGGVAFGLLDYYEMRQELRRTAEEGRIAFTAICFTHPKAKLEEYRKESDRRKPGPGMLLDALKASGEEPHNALMVGDRPEDEQAAKNAGVDFMWAKDFFAEEQEDTNCHMDPSRDAGERDLADRGD